MLVAEIPREGRCLEIGIGTGRIALPLTRAGVSIVGVDISREMLKKLMDKSDESMPLIAEADATRLPFGANTFSSAIAAHVLHLIPSWTVAVGELLRVVRPGGIVLATRGGGQRIGWGRQVMRRFFVEAGDPVWPPGADKLEELDKHMRSLGLVMRALPLLSAEGEMSIDAVITQLEAGYLSACWNLDEATRKKAAAVTREWAVAELGDLEKARPTRSSMVCTRTSFPKRAGAAGTPGSGSRGPGDGLRRTRAWSPAAGRTNPDSLTSAAPRRPYPRARCPRRAA
jgi:SAM-dependent methyltransferase